MSEQTHEAEQLRAESLASHRRARGAEVNPFQIETAATTAEEVDEIFRAWAEQARTERPE